MKHPKTRFEKLNKLMNMAITSREERSAKIEIQFCEEWIRKEFEKEEPSLYMIEVFRVQKMRLKKKLETMNSRIYFGEVDAGGLWGIQRMYLKKEGERLYVYVENLPSGWALSQVINKDEITIDGGTGWIAKVRPGSWDYPRKLMKNSRR